MALLDDIQRKAQAVSAETIAIRRHIHAHPELSFEEVNTAANIAEILTKWGIPFRDNVGGHGIVATICGRNGSAKHIALRADMDALPIQELNTVPYASKNPGVMHACGHDVHTASLLGTAKILKDTQDSWSGRVTLIFQPAEEKLPGGASLMLKDGLFKKGAPNAIFGQHVFPSLPAGKVGFRAGRYMASADEIYITIMGKGGHGAMPHLAIDPIVIAADVIMNLQQVVSRSADPTIPTVLTMGKIYSDGGATNIIPDNVCLEGTFRTMNEEWRAEAHHLIEKTVTNIAAAAGGTCEVAIHKGYPVLVNDENITFAARQSAIDYLGASNVVELPIRMTAEDFAYYTHLMPACFYRLGTGNKATGRSYPVHTPQFDIDESALSISTGLMAWMAIQTLVK